jgi:hypothetical protein
MIYRATIDEFQDVSNRASTRFAAMHRRYDMQFHVSERKIIADIDRLDKFAP